ncbi:MAG: GGDEF domain-containing response regulator [Candidatus Caldatribacteriaceae bacterium]
MIESHEDKNERKITKPKVAVVDDSQFIRYLVMDILEEHGFEVTTFARGEDFLSSSDLSDYDLVLLDIVLPDRDGFSLCEELRKVDEYATLPVIFLTAVEDDRSRIKSFEVGGNDYLLKPIRPKELLVRVETQIKLRRYVKELEKLNRELERLAFYDSLTSLPNRRAFYDWLGKLESQYERLQTPYSLIMVDLDRFKHYNDTFGHIHGDELLKSLALVLNQSVRKGDFVARFGGEEFVVLCFASDEGTGKLVAQRMKNNVESLSIVHPYNPPYGVVTVSCGVCGRRSVKNEVELMSCADQALYQAKNQGRNRVVGWKEVGGTVADGDKKSVDDREENI